MWVSMSSDIKIHNMIEWAISSMSLEIVQAIMKRGMV